MPVAFFGHGTPMNALEVNRYTQAWRDAAAAFPRPRAILIVSAHWYEEGVAVTAMERPRTIHDFGGFPRELYAMQYPAPGDPKLAERIASLLSPYGATLDDEWGLDHGAWSVLVHAYPSAEVPVLQLSIDMRLPAASHWEIGSALQPLRDEEILVLGSGNVVHNLPALDLRHRGGFDWGVAFDRDFAASLTSANKAALVEYERRPGGSLSVPEPDHYLPALYIAALRRDGESVSTIVEGMEAGAISMRAFRIG